MFYWFYSPNLFVVASNRSHIRRDTIRRHLLGSVSCDHRTVAGQRSEYPGVVASHLSHAAHVRG